MIIFLGVSGLEAEMSINTQSLDKVTIALKNNEHVFLFFSDGKSKSCKRMRSVLKEIKKELNKKVTIVEVLITDSKEEELIKAFKVTEVPLTLVIAPNGLIVNRFSNVVVSKETLVNSLISPVTASLIKANQKGMPVVLYFYQNDVSICKAVESLINATTKSFVGLLEIIKIDTNDKEEIKLQKEFKIAQVPTTLLISSDGMVVDRFEGAIEKYDFIKSLWKVCILSRSSRCAPSSKCGGCP